MNPPWRSGPQSDYQHAPRIYHETCTRITTLMRDELEFSNFIKACIRYHSNEGGLELRYVGDKCGRWGRLAGCVYNMKHNDSHIPWALTKSWP